MLPVDAESSSDAGGNLESDEPISGTEFEGYAGAGGGSRRGEEFVEEDAAELQEYARCLGLDPDVDRDLMWVAQEAFSTPLPACWTDHVDPEGRVYFCNQMTEESSWFHPTDVVFREVLELVKALRSERPPPAEARRAAALREHLLLAHRDAQAGLDGWSGPYDSEQGPYFYNRALDVSTWENPVDERERELAIRQRVLRRCLLTDWPGPKLYEAHNGEEVCAGSPRWGPPAMETALGLGAPSLGAALPRSPSSARSFRTAYSTRSLRSGRSATPSRARSRTSGMPSRSPAVSPAVKRTSSPRMGSGASNLRSLLKPILTQSGAELELAATRVPPPEQSRSPVRSPERSPVQRAQVWSSALPREGSWAQLPAQQYEGPAAPSTAEPLAAPCAQGQPSPPSVAAHAPAAVAEGTVDPAAVPGKPAAASDADQTRGAVEGAAQGPVPSVSTSTPADASTSREAAPAKDRCDRVSKPVEGKPGEVAPAADARAFDLAAAIAAFAGDASRQSLELPLGLSAAERKRAKALVDGHTGLKCESFGFGAERRMHVFKECTDPPDRKEPAGGVGDPDNAESHEFTFGKSDNLEIPKGPG